ncbi:MAG: ABC transporter ATP-binding protein [Acidobacteriota bacterium]
MNDHLITTENIWKIYKIGKEEVQALRGISLNIKRNEYIAVIGPSGSGKSTLMNILGCLDRPTKGEYYLNGKLVSSLNEEELALIRNKEIGFVFQVFNLLPNANAFHNVELPLIYNGTPKKERTEKVINALKMVDLLDRKNHRPSELSGGQRQKVAIARALVNNPSIILADEPTGNLDSVSGQEILKVFKKLHQIGNTIIVVTHENYVASEAQRIVYIRDGKIEKEVLNQI